MSSIVIKISHNGLSKEYLFNKLGPILIGSDERCDVRIDDPSIEAKVLELKLSGGNIFVKSVSTRTEIQMDSVVLPSRQETRLNEHSTLALLGVDYKISVQKNVSDIIEPPPFFEDDFKSRLSSLTLRISEREKELRSLDSSQDKKKLQLVELEDKYHQHAREKNRLEIEVTTLRTQKEMLSQEIRKTKEAGNDEQDRIGQLKDFLKKLENEERHLKDTIVAENLVLKNLKDEKEKRFKEIEEQRHALHAIELDKSKMEQQFKQLALESDGQADEIKVERLKIQKILTETDEALKEKSKVKETIAQSLREKVVIDHDLVDLKDEHDRLEGEKKNLYAKLSDLRITLDNEKDKASRVKEEIKHDLEEEASLKNLNNELRISLSRVEEKLSHKKNQLNQIEFDHQNAVRKLSTITFELEKSSSQLNELANEKRAGDLRMLSLREEIQNFTKKIADDKKNILKEIEDEKSRHREEIHHLQSLKEEELKERGQLEIDRGILKVQIEEAEVKFRQLQIEKKSIETYVANLEISKIEMENQVSNLKTIVSDLDHHKYRLNHELTQLQVRLLECETNISEKLEEGRVELENYKREERAKILAEKEVLLSEVEAFKQKSMIEVESDYRRKMDDVHKMKGLAQQEANEIISEARRVENEITHEAQQRLKLATSDAQERELRAHERIQEAQKYFKVKEQEADLVINQSRLEAKRIIKRTEDQLQEDLIKRKIKIRNFLNMRREKGLLHMSELETQHLLKMKKDQEAGRIKLEDLKRRELKKIARIREDEIIHQQQIRESALKALKAEKLKITSELENLKKSQEMELSEKKKSVLEHINSTKYSQQRAWEEELQREKDTFNRSKKTRIQNATLAVLNVFIAEGVIQSDEDPRLRDKIQHTLSMAIDGQKADALKEVGQILDYNPDKHKKVFQVLKKYTLRVGVPAAVAITLLADIGDVRSNLIGGAKYLLKQQNSASEIYVNQQKTEWKEKHTFSPATTPDYKETYVQNIIYTTDFEKNMEDENFQNEWMLKVHDYLVKDLELSEDVAISFISSESSLIKELAVARKDLHPQFLDQGLAKLSDLEKFHLGWLSEKISNADKLQRFSTFRKEQYDQFYKSKYDVGRDLASEAKAK